MLPAVVLWAGTACSGVEAVPASPTFNRDVAPILHAHCAACHRGGGMAPFSLLTYEDARTRAGLIAAVTQSRRMPPWLPDSSDYPFADERRLTGRELLILQRWAAQGAVRGVEATPTAPPQPDSVWPLGAPDLIVELPQAYLLRAGTGDVFRNFVLPVPLQSPRHVRAVDLQAGGGHAVHHAVLAVDPTPSSRQDDAADAEPGFDGMFGRRGARPPPGFFVGWTPGRVPRPDPSGLSWTLEPGTDLVLQMHLRPHAQDVEVRPRIALYFADAPPTRTPVLLRLGAQTLDIPAGAGAYAVRDSLALPVATDLIGLYPHAHYLARSMAVDAVLPGGAVRRLLRIRDWDFNWQDAYTFTRPVSLPAGSVLRLHYVYDNSAANERNPHRPPRRVVYGPRSDDEMAELWIQAVPRVEADLAALQQALARKAAHDYLEGWQHLVRLNPADAVAHANLAAYHASRGDRSRAVGHYRAAIAARPDFAAAHYNLALVLEAQHPDSALHHYEQALHFRPDHAGTHNNLGNLLLARGLATRAVTHFRRAIELEPGQAEAHNNLGRLLQDQGRTADAIAHYRRASEVRPDAAPPHFNLALALASVGRTAEAVDALEAGLHLEPRAVDACLALAWSFATHPDAGARDPARARALAERAAAMIGQPHPRVLDVIAAAEAADGRFDRAAALATDAVRLARAVGDSLLSGELTARERLYRQQRPYVAGRAGTAAPPQR